jgi:hypothetical protein
MTVLPDRSSSPTRLLDSEATRPRSRAGSPAVEPEAVLLDEHEPAGVRAGQLAQARGDPVEHGLQVTLRVHVGDHVAEAADHARPLGHVVPGDVVLAGLVADVDPAEHFAVAVGQRAGVDADVEHRPVLADPPGREGDLAATPDPLEDRVVLGGEFLGDHGERQAHYLFSGPAEHPLRGRVPQHHVSVGVERDDGVGGGFDDRARGHVYPLPVALNCASTGRDRPRSAPPTWG